MDPRVLAALPDDLRMEIVQTIPLRRNGLFATGNCKPPRKHSSDLRPQAEQEHRTLYFKCITQRFHAAEASLEELLASSFSHRIPFQLEMVLDALLRGNQDIIVWSEETSSIPEDESVLSVLWKVKDWIQSADDVHMEPVSLALKTIRRLGDRYESSFGPCCDDFIENVQRSFLKQRGYELDLRSCFRSGSK